MARSHPHITARSFGYIDPNIPNPNGPNDTSIIIYGYTPSLALAAFAATWFFLHLVVHTLQTHRHRSWWWLPFSVGLVFEIIGYIARALSARQDPYNLIYFVLNYFFIVTAPVFLAAGIYTILSGLIPRLGRQYALLPPRVILWFFITSDVISTVVQIAGAVLVGVRESRQLDPSVANQILLGGLAYQVFAMTVFIVVAAGFLVRARRVIWTMKGRRKGEGHEGTEGPAYAVFCGVFGLATLLVYLRTIFRLAETAEGLGATLATHEVYFACLEFAPIAAVVLLFAVWHPGRFVGAKVGGPAGSLRVRSYGF
ncbi:RTA1-domain-containing protein [Aspergillus japonicus CBS 114.51]|uniref:RTA1-domain-containing protein n=2 Tax=Aspergillus TaxID=5052 RepID=A0A2V5H7F7_ASPV1|nr:RTA1-domain-containing protein [Aspergillus japonicus CBS 114.51]PYI18052.1 RTA1-domain-containing protein [Aspergillus violaceofuscus CBS 115571]RAH79469.1 RTA1-domain-containing protein [Aspergillus japonicus CBS 114.51]